MPMLIFMPLFALRETEHQDPQPPTNPALRGQFSSQTMHFDIRLESPKCRPSHPDHRQAPMRVPPCLLRKAKFRLRMNPPISAPNYVRYLMDDGLQLRCICASICFRCEVGGDGQAWYGRAGHGFSRFWRCKFSPAPANNPKAPSLLTFPTVKMRANSSTISGILSRFVPAD
ncbi:hypothetical protein BC830DRAFT_1159840 [Chytriomyces sp. MP71]|nr:hypothetical protein BC830DRAFT_1159840 [Chytriomyces sp. MP71]